MKTPGVRCMSGACFINGVLSEIPLAHTLVSESSYVNVCTGFS